MIHSIITDNTILLKEKFFGRLRNIQTLHREICDIIEDHDRLTFSKVAEFIGCSKSGISNFKSNGIIGFRKLLRLSYLLFPSSQKKIMGEWCLRLVTTESIKHSFEYASITRDKELLRKLIEKHRAEKGSLGEYVAVYSVLYKFYTNEISGGDLIKNLKKVAYSKDATLRVLVEIIKCYNYYHSGKFHLMLETAEEAESMLHELSDKRELFIKECYLHRLAEVFGPVHLHFNNLESAKHYASIIINADICPKTVSDATYIVGMSNLLTDTNKAIEYLQKSYDISKGVGESDIIKGARINLDLAKLYFDIELDEDSNPTLVRLQQNKISEIELKSVKNSLFQDGDEDFIVLLEARESCSLTELYNCFRKFFNQSNYLFASLVAKEIKEFGEDSRLIDELIDFKIEIKGEVKFEKTYISCFNRLGSYRWEPCA